MNYEITEETLEEGRVALYQLEKQLKERGNNILSDTVSESSSNKLNTSTQERKILDQKPRVERLNHRLESLGLTVEELDDRGLLDGGGSLPSYNTSLKNKNRRTLELQSRSNRLQGRGKEIMSKLINGLLHMIRTLSSKGLDLEQYFKTLDPNNRGLLNRKKFFSILKQIGLPYGNRELNDITQHYTVPSSDQADYISLLKDTGIIIKVVEDNGTTSSNSVNNNGNNSHGNNQSVNPATDNIDISIYTIVISDVKRMILESISSRSKHQDDVYRMFARWDTQGTGTITATQFLRVLAKLHINLTDQDQDFLVELLDTNGMGRIDFEGLLNFCFSTDKLQSPSTNVYRNNNNSNNNNTLLSPTTNTFSASSFSVDDNKDGGETMSAVSTEGNTSLEHRGSGSSDNHHHHINNFNISSRRPHTASLSRPYHSSLQANYYGSNSNINNNNSNSSNHTHRIEHTSSSTTNGIMTSNINDKNNNNNSNINNNRVYLPSSNAKSPPQRPLTASGRVISSQKNKFSPATVVLLDRENSQYVVELPDDVIYGEENYLSVDNTNLKQQQQQLQQQKQQKQLQQQQQQQQQQINVGGKLPYTGILNNNNNNNSNNISSFNNFITEVSDNNDENNNIRTVKYVPQDQFIEQFSSQVMTNNNDNNYNNRNLNNGNNIYSYNYIPSTTYIPSGSINILNNNNNNIGNVSNNSNINSNDPATMIDAKLNIISRQNSSNNINNNNTNIMNNAHHNNRQVGINNSAQFLSTAAAAEPSEHLVLLATQILTTLREIIMTRYRRGKSLLEIYGHFDRECKQYFDANDFIIATADLKIETSNRVANIAINLIAIDGYDKVSFGEFKVFVLDSDHKLLEMNIQEQIAQFLEQKGREYQSYMIDMFWNEDDSNDIDNNNHNYNNNQNNHIHRKQHKYQQTENEFLSRNRFINSLQKIGLILTSTEESRIADRFDIHGNDMCCISRFIYMIQNSRAWKHAEQVLAFQDEAIEEAIFLRQQLKLGQKHISDSDLPQISEELISMCEYLGIRVLSERNMIWIAADALKAPLPISWTAQKDSNGRIFFFNHLTNQSKLEHPLDPHFRKLRDKYRQSALDPHNEDNNIIGHGSRDSVVLPTNFIPTTMAMSEPSVMNIINSNNNNNINNNQGILTTSNMIQRPQVTFNSSNYNNNNNNNSSQSLTHHAFNNSANISNINNNNNTITSTTASPSRVHTINKRRPQSAIDYNLMSNNNSTNNNNSGNNNNTKQNSALNFKMNATSNDIHSIRNFIDMRTLLASTTSSYNRPVSAPIVNQDFLVGNGISTAAAVGAAGTAFGSAESSIYNKLKNTSSNLMNFEAKQRNDILPVETIYTTGDTGARRYGVPAFRPRSSSAQRPSAVDRALNINSNNRNNNNSDVKNAFFPSPSRGGSSSSNNNVDVSLTRPMTGNSQNRTYNNNDSNNNKQAKLSEMLEGNIIERLDHALGRR